MMESPPPYASALLPQLPRHLDVAQCARRCGARAWLIGLATVNERPSLLRGSGEFEVIEGQRLESGADHLKRLRQHVARAPLSSPLHGELGVAVAVRVDAADQVTHQEALRAGRMSVREQQCCSCRRRATSPGHRAAVSALPSHRSVRILLLLDTVPIASSLR